MTNQPPPSFCEACESEYRAGPVCPRCGTETCARCGWCDECAAKTVTFASDFRPEKIPMAEFPHPAASAVRGSTGTLWTVVDRGGYSFVACCAAHERAGTASGFYPQRDQGRILGEWEPVSAAPADDCGRDTELVPLTESDVGTTLPCGDEVTRANIPCGYHAERYGVAQPDCPDCEFGVPAVYHECSAA